MTNHVTYAIELTPENAPKIDAINRIILGSAYATVEANVATTETEQKATKPSAKAEKAVTADRQKVAQQAKTEKEAETTTTTLDDVKTAAKKAKADHGEDFAMEVLKTAGVEVAATLGRSMAKIPAEYYDSIIQDWLDGPKVTEQASDEPEDDLDDGFDDDEDNSEVTADAVKIALKAYAKEVGRDEAKEIMQKHGAAALSKVDDCTPKQLSAMFAELV